VSELKKLTSYVDINKTIYKNTPHEKYLKASWVLYRKNNEKIYDNFEQQLRAYLLKVTNPIPKKYIGNLLDKHLVYIGHGNLASDLPIFSGGALIADNKFAGIVLDSVFLRIDSTTGNTLKPDSCFYASYFHFVRGCLLLNDRMFKNDEILNDLAVKYYAMLLLKILGKNVYLNEKERIFLEIITKYFYERFLNYKVHDYSIEAALKKHDKDVKDEVKSTLDGFKRYDDAKDIFKGLIDFKLTTESANMLMMQLLKRYGSVIFHSMTTTSDFLVATSIVSKYPADFLKDAFISSSIQDKIEQHVQKNYMNKVTYKLNLLP
jgi:hypothetical protein